MAIVKPTTTGASSYIEELGDDRGVQIEISKSTFANSRFCKGMLVYKRRPQLESSFDTLIYSLANSNSETPTVDDDNSKI